MIHIIPNREIKLHIEETTCRCEPRVEIDDEIIVIHNELNRFRESDYIADESEGTLTLKNKDSAAK